MYNYVSYYTDARYTVWETEGEYGDTSYLQHDSSIMDNSSYFIKLKPDAVCGEKELIWGPYYTQYVYETNNDRSIILSKYTPVFRMKLEVNPNPPSCEDTTVWTDNPESPICIIQVTQSKLKYPNDWTFECTHPIREEIITLNRFQSLGQFKDIYFTAPSYYDLLSDACQPVTLEEPPPQVNTENMELYVNGNDLLKQRGYIEFKVIWLGNPNYLLSIDKVTVYDSKGQELMDPLSDAEAKIDSQLIQLSTYNSNILGWFGRDEPNSIDQYAPIKKVIEIINDHTNNQSPLWLALMGKWDGAFSNRADPNGTYHLSPWKEMKKRIGNMNVWQDIYMFDYPYQENGLYDPPPGETWQEANIRITSELNYKPAYELDPNFGVSLQCGEVHFGTIAQERNIFGYELMYETNLALMNGAKFLSLYTYFAQRNTDSCNSGWTCHAIVDREPNGTLTYTGKYDTLLTIISPRLKGLMGKTLKKLTPTEQYLNHTLSSSEGFIQSITKGGCTVQGMQPSDEAYDLGFFKDNLDRDYFMLISRWYNSGCNPALTININPVYFPDNYNLKVVNLINNTTLNTITKYGYIYSAPEVGDACFFSIAPVVKYGGLLAYNDTIKTNTTLSDNMTIDAGKVLQINEGKTYTITDTITFTDTLSFITGYGYINRTQSGLITTRSWNRSLFKGRSGSHPKLIWSKHPDITNVIDYKIYRNHSNGGWQYLTTKSSNIFEYIDSTITIIEGMPQANETSTQYRVTATYRPSKLVIETSPTNTILYHRVEGQGLEKQNSGLLSNDFTFNLDQNYPNPFNPSTTISYSLAEDGIVTLEILNILGERIKTLVNDFKTRGNHNISFNASSLASGVYIYKIQAGTFINSKKMILLK